TTNSITTPSAPSSLSTSSTSSTFDLISLLSKDLFIQIYNAFSAHTATTTPFSTTNSSPPSHSFSFDSFLEFMSTCTNFDSITCLLLPSSSTTKSTNINPSIFSSHAIDTDFKVAIYNHYYSSCCLLLFHLSVIYHSTDPLSPNSTNNSANICLQSFKLALKFYPDLANYLAN
ncbi:hypothetical protein AX774_g7646, partial [Zancudomyces culisetae]